MFDRIFFPTLTFAALIAATAAFTIDAIDSAAPQARQTVVQLERVVVVAKRDGGKLTIAQAESGKTTN